MTQGGVLEARTTMKFWVMKLTPPRMRSALRLVESKPESKPESEPESEPESMIGEVCRLSPNSVLQPNSLLRHLRDRIP
jgi:hypothetical protein